MKFAFREVVVAGDKVGAGARPLDLVGLLLRPRVVVRDLDSVALARLAVRLDDAEGVETAGNRRPVVEAA